MNPSALAVLLLAIWTAASSCSHQVQPWPVDCPPSAPTGARPIEAETIDSLVGQYEVTFVSLSHGTRPLYWRGHLDLTASDTLERYYVRTLGGYVKRGFRPLIGTFRNATDSLGHAERAEVEGRVLFLGCRGCIDGSPYELRLLSRTPAGVWGLWEDPQNGIDRLADSAGNWLPNPAGHYCMRRVD